MALFPIVSPGPTLTDISLSEFGVPVVSNLNQLIFALNPALSPWTAYTPIWEGSTGAPAIGTGSLVGRFMRLGKVGFLEITQVMGTGGSFGSGIYTWSLPFGWVSASNPGITVVCGNAQVYDAAPTPTVYIGAVNVASSADRVNISTHMAPAGPGPMTAVSPIAILASGDIIQLQICLELT